MASISKFLTKPVLKMVKICNNSSNSGNSVSAESPAILLVDDNEINLKVLYQTLDGHGYKLLVARSGEDALRIARKAKPDLILLDIMMPGIDGYETCTRLKADESTRNSVVIFLTALQNTQEKVRGLSLGAMDFITKPFDPEEIIARVSIQIGVHRRHQELLAENKNLAGKLEDALRSNPLESSGRSERIKSLISSGENDRVEFKSRLRWNLKTGRS